MRKDQTAPPVRHVNIDMAEQMAAFGANRTATAPRDSKWTTLYLGTLDGIFAVVGVENGNPIVLTPKVSQGRGKPGLLMHRCVVDRETGKYISSTRSKSVDYDGIRQTAPMWEALAAAVADPQSNLNKALRGVQVHPDVDAESK